MNVERTVEFGVPAAILAGVSLAVSPVSAMVIENRWINAVYVLPLLLLGVAILTIGVRTERDLAGDIGYWMTLVGVVVLLVGSALEAVFPPALLLEWQLGGGIVFFAGFYVLLFGGLFLGIGLLRTSSLSPSGPALLALSFPLAVVGFRAFNMLGLEEFNWVPFSVPYGLAWIVLGLDLRATHPERARLGTDE
jgi:hypothetical protein